MGIEWTSMVVTWSDSQYENYEQRISSQWNAAIQGRDSILSSYVDG